VLEKGKISPGQAAVLMILTVLATENLIQPTISANYARADAWMLTVFAAVFQLGLIFIIDRTGKMFPGESPVHWTRTVLGTYLGMAVIILYLFYQLWLNCLIIRTIAEFLLTAFMPDTPIAVFVIVLTLLAAWVVKAGLEVLVRCATFIIPVFLVTFCLILVLLVREMDLSQITPVLEQGIKPVLKGSILPIVWRGEIVLMFFLWPYLNRPEQGFKAMVWVVVAITIVMLPTTIAVTTIFGPTAPHHIFPTYALVRYISVGQFVERVDAVVMALWIAGAFIKIGAFYYVVCLVLSELLKLKEYQAVVYPLGVIQGVLSIAVAPNVAVLTRILDRVVTSSGLTFEYLIPIVLIVCAYLRGLHRKPHDQVQER